MNENKRIPTAISLRHNERRQLQIIADKLNTSFSAVMRMALLEFLIKNQDIIRDYQKKEFKL